VRPLLFSGRGGTCQLVHSSAAFEPEAIAATTEAFEVACKALRETDRSAGIELPFGADHGGRVDISFPAAHPALGEWTMSIGSKRVRNPANERASVGMKRGLSQADLSAVRRGIGAALRTLYSDVLGEEIPGRIGELLSQLDQQLRQPDQKDRDGA
jgi:hypothetical protein